MADLRVAIVGVGGIGKVHLARWANVDGASVTAVCDLNATDAMRVAAEFDAEAHTDWKAMLRGGDIDIVDICVPPNLHAPIAIEALSQGIHVLCEKPLARTLDEARQIADKVYETGKMLMPAFCHRFHPQIAFAKELIQQDDLGKVIMVRNRFSGLFVGVDEKWFSDADISGGGTLMDTAVHSIDLFRFLVGEVKNVSGRLATFNPRLNVEDSAVMVLEAESGALGVIEASWTTPGGKNVVEIYGTAGVCTVDYDDGLVRYKTADMSVWETKEIFGDDRFQLEIDHFAEAVRGNTALRITVQDGLRANEIIAELYG